MIKHTLYQAVFLLLTAVIFLGSASKISAAPPQYFQSNPIITTGLSSPTTIEFAPDGRLFILQRTGEVKIYKNGALLTQNFVTLPSANTGDRGLIGIAFDPDYAINKYVYFYYTSASDLKNYLIRYSAATDVATDGPVIIFHTNDQSFQLHVGGGLVFGNDKKIYLGVGDNGYPPNAQNLGSYHGKILRLNRDGSAPADNPFIGTPGVLPEIYAYGLRNPWRLTFDHSTNRLYVGDVGDSTWEEINHIAAGQNYGWPTCEGVCGVSGMINPLYTYPHSGNSSSVTMGPVYHGSMFPASYQNQIFFADYARGFIRNVFLNSSGAFLSSADFDLSAGSVVDVKEATDGSLYYVTYYPGRVYRISYSTSDQVPVANASADVTKGIPTLTVHFSSSGSFDPEGTPLQYLWDFGDGTTSTAANPVHSYSYNGAFTVELHVSDSTHTSQAVPVIVQVGLAPIVTIGMPADGSSYVAGDSIAYTAHAVDGVGNDINDSAITTEVLFHHGTHIHPFLGPITGRTGNFTVPTTGEADPNVWFEIKATATDYNGLTSTKSIYLYPKKVNVSLTTNPAGLTFKLDGQPQVAPLNIQQVVGISREVNASSPVYKDGKIYEFSNWSDGGAQIHNITVPTTDMALTANYIQTGTIAGFTGDFYSNANLAGTPIFSRNDMYPLDFNWHTDAPDPRLPADNFSIRWTGNLDFSAGTYRFYATGDDGIRLYVDGVLQIDEWHNQSATSYTKDVDLVAGSHEIKYEYFDSGLDAVAKLSWEKISSPVVTPTPTPTPTLQPTPTPAPNYTGEYFNNYTLSGTPTLVREDPLINFNWGGVSPVPGLDKYNFSVRWTKTDTFQSGLYRFVARGDDGIRLYVDNNLVFDEWHEQSPTTYTFDIPMSAGSHILRFEYFQKCCDSIAQLSYQLISTQITPTPTAMPTPTPTLLPTPTPIVPTPTPTVTSGFAGDYFNNYSLSGSPTFTRTDPAINFNWGGVSPAPGLDKYNFSVRWTKTENFANGTYRFTAKGDDGIRLFVDNVLVFDEWHEQSPTTYTFDHAFTSGTHNLRFEYFQKCCDSVAQLSYQLITPTTPTPTPINTPTPTPLPTPTPTTSIAPTPTPTPVSQTLYTGEYFNNYTLSGAPTVVRQDPLIKFNWGGVNPVSGLDKYNFSVRWTKTDIFAAGTYKFTAKGDDGIRLFIDNNLVFNEWHEQSPTSYTFNVDLTNGSHVLKFEYFQKCCDSVAEMSYELVTPATPTPTPTSVVLPTATPTPTLMPIPTSTPSVSFTGSYFKNISLSGSPVLVRNDANIDFNWHGDRPDPLLDIDSFSIRWIGSALFENANYRFNVQADDGTRLYIDNLLILDDWTEHGAVIKSVDKPMSAGIHDIKLEYFEACCDASVKLWLQKL